MKTKRGAVQTITAHYIIALFPLIIYGLYKNGYLLYERDLINIFGMTKLLLIPIGAFLLGYLVEFFFYKDKKDLKETFLPLYGLIIACVINPNINILIFYGILLVGLVIVKMLLKQKFIIINPICLIKIMFIIALIILGVNNYENLLEMSVNKSLSPINIIFGRGVGGLFSTNIFLILLALGFLSLTKLYKKEIPLYMLGSYIVLMIGLTIFLNSDTDILISIFNSTVFFSAVFIAPEMLGSTYSKKGKMVYGILLGILCAIGITFIDPISGVFIAILVGSLTIKLIDKIFALR